MALSAATRERLRNAQTPGEVDAAIRDAERRGEVSTGGQVSTQKNLPGESDAERRERERENREGGQGGAPPEITGSPAGPGAQPGDDDDRPPPTNQQTGPSGRPVRVGDTITVKGVTIVVTQVSPNGSVAGVNPQGGLSQFTPVDLQRSGLIPPTTQPGNVQPPIPGQQPGIPGPAISTTVPGATPGLTEAPVDFTDFLETLGLGDAASSFVLNRFGAGAGLAPFQGRLEQLAEAQVFPFLVQQAMGTGGQGLTSEDFTARQFQDFLGTTFGQPTHTGPFGIGQSLRQAGNFLRNPELDGVLSPGQEFLQSQLQRPGLTGASGFSPLTSLVGQQALGAAPGVRGALQSAYQRSVQNLLNQDPTRFLNSPDLIDFLAGQGVIR